MLRSIQIWSVYMGMNWFVTIFVVLILGVVLSACGGNTPIPNSEDMDSKNEELPPVAAVRAREALSNELGIGIEEIAFVSHDQTTWFDSCLGLGGPAESCLQSEIDGWLVELSTGERTYKAHTDWLGDQVRFER
jgi:hypothetical protein